MRRVASSVVLAVVALLGASPSWAADRQKAADGFVELTAHTTPDDVPAHPERFPDSLVKGRSGWSDAKTTEWRAALLKRLRGAQVKGVREGKMSALVRATIESDEVEIPLRWDGSHWVLAAAREYLVGGPTFDTTAKSGPVHVTLAPYTQMTDANFAKAAYSFGYATGDMRRAKNRADLWYVAKARAKMNGESDAGIVDLGVGKLDRAKEVPLPDSWSQALDKPQKGHVYVVHCRQDRRWDLYVAIAVTKADPKALEFDWNVLALGEDSPTDLKKPGAADSNDGADGLPGLDAD